MMMMMMIKMMSTKLYFPSKTGTQKTEPPPRRARDQNVTHKDRQQKSWQQPQRLQRRHEYSANVETICAETYAKLCNALRIASYDMADHKSEITENEEIFGLEDKIIGVGFFLQLFQLDFV